jgi:hypothetical protein
MSVLFIRRRYREAIKEHYPKYWTLEVAIPISAAADDCGIKAINESIKERLHDKHEERE